MGSDNAIERLLVLLATKSEGEAEGLPRGHVWTGAEVGGSRQGWKQFMMVRVGSSSCDTFMIKIKTATLEERCP